MKIVNHLTGASMKYECFCRWLFSLVVRSPFRAKHLLVVRYRQAGPDVPVPCPPPPPTAWPPPSPPICAPPLYMFVPLPLVNVPPLWGKCPPSSRQMSPLLQANVPHEQLLLLKIEQRPWAHIEGLFKKKKGYYGNSSPATISIKR